MSIYRYMCVCIYPAVCRGVRGCVCDCMGLCVRVCVCKNPTGIFGNGNLKAVVRTRVFLSEKY